MRDDDDAMPADAIRYADEEVEACVQQVNALLAQPWSPEDLLPRARNGYRPSRLFDVSRLAPEAERRLADRFRAAGWIVEEERPSASRKRFLDPGWEPEEERPPETRRRFLRFTPPVSIRDRLLAPDSGEPE